MQMVSKEALLTKGLSQLYEMHQSFLGKADEFLKGVKSVQEAAATIRALKKGDRGADGGRGPQGIPGVARDGRDGADGRDGISPQIDKEEIALMVARMIAKPKDGKDAEIPSIDSIVASVIEELTKDDKLGVDKRISGFRSEIASYRNQLAGKVYGKDTWARGSGTTVSAGSNITLTPLPNGTTQINASGSGSSGYQVPTVGVVDGVNRVFTWATEPNVIVLDNGNAMNKVSSDGTINWTGTTTTTLTQAPNFNIYATA